jgi:magnesium-transporting ATPase (P-type)
MLTGESLPVDKDASASERAVDAGPDDRRFVFLGTSVVSGTAIAETVATGPATMFGEIAGRLRARLPETEFEHGLRRFSLLILRTTVALVLFILLTGLTLRRDPFESLLFAVALGVGLTPEFLPMIASVTLTAGALRMAREGVIVKHLVLAGFLAFADPIHADAGTAIAALARDGVTVKILTGDNEHVTRHVCGRIGLPAAHIVSGDEIARLDDAALGHVAERADAFTRISPARKNRILLALKRRGHVVGFLGDGINDAPSLHAADVGISVMTATEVAREGAEIVLGRSGLGVLHRGIMEGRKASGNMMKYLLMGPVRTSATCSWPRLRSSSRFSRCCRPRSC